ncbi:MAG: hypothetical protein ACE5R4_01605, partial [Armatimonadota bacterium]
CGDGGQLCMGKIDWATLEDLSKERLDALEEHIATNIRREIEAKRRELEEQERKKRKKRRRRRR